MPVEAILAIFGALGLVGFFLMLIQILKFFPAPTQQTLNVVITGTVCRGAIDFLINALFELIKSICGCGLARTSGRVRTGTQRAASLPTDP